MKKTLIFAAICIMAASCARNDNPFLCEWDTPYGIPPFDKIGIEHYVPAFKEGIARQEKEIKSIINNSEAPSFANVIEALDRSGDVLDRVSGVLFNLSESMNTPEMEAVMNEILPIASEHNDNIYMNPELFAKVKAVYDAPHDALSREQQMLLKKVYEAFVNNGIGLPVEQQTRLREINSRLSTLSQQFGTNILAQNNAYAKEFGSSISEYYDRMAGIEDRDLRRRMFEAYSSRCANGGENDNNAIILEILRLRQEKARILGYETPAQWILHDKMASDPATVDAFLSGIMKAAVSKAREEVSQIRKMMGGKKVEPWDYMYYMARIKEQKYALNEDEIKPYFQMEKVREGVFSAAHKLYGLNFKKILGAPVYHPEVEVFEVTDADGSLIGIQLTDYYPRDTKRGGAWMSEFRGQRVIDGKDIRPIIVNVGNFNKPEGDTPALMSIDNVETMFHEFGHALHGLLSKCNYLSLSGTNVSRDFVELPSQINENWAFRADLLTEYARHYKSGEVIPQDMVDKILATRTFNQGFRTTELCAASILDLKWHMLSEIPEDADAQWVADMEKKFCEEMGLVDEIIPRYRSSYFNHIFGGGYACGYYSYLWAEVLDKDAFQVFVREGVFNPETGMRFRREVLEKGGSDEPMTLYRNFAGADPDPKYLLAARGLK